MTDQKTLEGVAGGERKEWNLAPPGGRFYLPDDPVVVSAKGRKPRRSDPARTPKEDIRIVNLR